jgi:hypothetical protein
MRKILFCVFLFGASAFGQTPDKARMDLFKKESAGLSGAIEEAVSGVVPGRSILETPKATYLDGYGAVISLEASLEPTRSPFSSLKSPAEVRAIVSERRQGIQKKLEALLKQRVAAMQSVMSTDSVTVVLYLLNSNPADVPDLPSQILFTMKKEDPSQVRIQQF